jgi:hypothetical protein
VVYLSGSRTLDSLNSLLRSNVVRMLELASLLNDAAMPAWAEIAAGVADRVMTDGGYIHPGDR